MNRPMKKSLTLLIALSLVLVTSCCPKPTTKIEYYPEYVRPKQCAKGYDEQLQLIQWVKGTAMGNPKNVKITMDNVSYLIYQIQRRDATIKCYDNQAE